MTSPEDRKGSTHEYIINYVCVVICSACFFARKIAIRSSPFFSITNHTDYNLSDYYPENSDRRDQRPKIKDQQSQVEPSGRAQRRSLHGQHQIRRSGVLLISAGL